jgi:lactate permease
MQVKNKTKGCYFIIVHTIKPCYCTTLGFRKGFLECWPVALISGASFAIIQAIFANLVGPELPDLIAGLASLFATVIFVQFWKPKYRPEFVASMDQTKSLADDEENEKVSSSNASKKDELAGSSEKVLDESNSSKHGSGEVKQEISNTEDVTQENDDNDNENENDGPAVGMEVVKPTLKQSILAWSPWLLIVVVVIM